MEPFYLEEWIRKRVDGEEEKNIPFNNLLGGNRKEFDRIILEKFQTYKLHRILEYVYEKSPFYRELLTKNSVEPSAIRSLSDLSKIPFTQAGDVSDFAYGFSCVPMGKVSRIFTLPIRGTTSDKKNILFTEKDLLNIIDLFSAYTRVVGGKKKNVVQILLPGTSPLGQADLLAKGVEKAGSIPVITGVTDDSMKQIQAIRKNRSTILVGYPSYIYRVTQEANQRYRLEDLGITTIVTTGEHIPSSMRNAIRNLWKAELFSQYGLTEMGLGVGIECDAHKGYHVDEADFIAEIVSPKTGEVLANGEEGELVLTSLNREGMPLIRYRTRDLSRIIEEHCECGSILKRIDMVIKRIG